MLVFYLFVSKVTRFNVGQELSDCMYCNCNCICRSVNSPCLHWMIHRFIVFDGLGLCSVLQGYIVYSIRKKLKKQYIHLNGKQIEKLKKSGVEVSLSMISLLTLLPIII